MNFIPPALPSLGDRAHAEPLRGYGDQGEGRALKNEWLTIIAYLSSAVQHRSATCRRHFEDRGGEYDETVYDELIHEKYSISIFKQA